MLLGLRTTIYKVGNMDLAKEWYTKIFQNTPYFDEPYYVGYNIAGYELGLQPEEYPMSAKAETVVVYWGVDDIQKEYKRMLDLGASECEAPHNVGGPIMVATLKDPWGNVIGIIYNPVFKLPS